MLNLRLFFYTLQGFLSNSHYEIGFVSRYWARGILPRFFATGKPLPQGHIFKMRIGDVFPPRSGFVQQSAEEGLANPLRPFANLLAATFGDNKIRIYEVRI
jgi:hypothetical protein